MSTVVDDADKLADKAAKLVADWPDLTPEQLGRIASVVKAAALQADGSAA